MDADRELSHEEQNLVRQLRSSGWYWLVPSFLGGTATEQMVKNFLIDIRSAAV
jgi:hypothetical protein